MPDAILEKVLLVVLGGIFGWLLGKLPEKWVYVIMVGAILLTLVQLQRGVL